MFRQKVLSMDLFFKSSEIEYTEFENLKKFSFFKIGGNARYFALPKNPEQLSSIIKACKEDDMPIYYLGRGSNLLISDEMPDCVVVHFKYFNNLKITGNTVIAGSGYNFSHLIVKTLDIGLSGLHTLCGIPASVGGAVFMNAGGKYGDISDSVEKIVSVDHDVNINEFKKDEINFTYRNSNLADNCIVSAEFCLHQDSPEKLWKIHDEILNVKKESQPLNIPSAGCIFKNPHTYSAGELIEKTGLKGSKIGGASVSIKHANFIVNEGFATSKDVIDLIDVVRNKVLEKFGIFLDLEVRLW